MSAPPRATSVTEVIGGPGENEVRTDIINNGESPRKKTICAVVETTKNVKEFSSGIVWVGGGGAGQGGGCSRWAWALRSGGPAGALGRTSPGAPRPARALQAASSEMHEAPREPAAGTPLGHSFIAQESEPGRSNRNETREVTDAPRTRPKRGEPTGARARRARRWEPAEAPHPNAEGRPLGWLLPKKPKLEALKNDTPAHVISH